MDRDSDSGWIHWHRPASLCDALRQVCINVPLMIVFCFMSIGEFFWYRIIKKVFICTCFNFQLPHQSIQGKEYKKDRAKTSAPLPKLRKLGSNPDGSQKIVADQAGSVLYSKLPLEIRTLIFEFALFGDGKAMHIYRRRKQIHHLRCQRQFNGQPCTYAHPCSNALPHRELTAPQGHDFFDTQHLSRFYDSSRFERDNPWGVVALMRTCRQVYYDVTSILYTKTHFHFPHPTDLALFSSRVETSLLECIKIMSFDVGDFDSGFAIESTDQLSNGTSTVSSGLTGLKELRVFVKKWVGPPRLGPEEENAEQRGGQSIGGLVLGCNIKEREGLDVFEVIVPGRQFKTWEGMLTAKRGIDLCVYRDDKIPDEAEAETESVHDDEHGG